MNDTNQETHEGVTLEFMSGSAQACIRALRNLESTANMLEKYAPEIFPEVNEQGQKHFGRVMMESAAEAIRAAWQQAIKEAETIGKAPLIYPREMTETIWEILGTPNFRAAQIVHIFRAGGAEIPRKAEAEQAYYIHWALKHAIVHGDKWRDEAEKDISAAIEKVRSAEAGATA